VSGTETFTYTFTDVNGDADTATVTMTINPVNDPASFGGNTSGMGAEDGGAITGALTASDAADGMTTPNFTVSVAASNGVASIDPVSGAWSYTPNADFNGLDLFTASVTDDDGNVETQVILLTVNAVVDIVDDADSSNEDTAVITSVLANDSFENAGRTITAVTQGANGTVAIVDAVAGTLSYTPNANFNGIDTYTYTVSSGGVTETATVTVTINAVNDAPVTGPDVVTTIAGQPVTFDVRTNDIDPDGDTLFVSEINGIPIAAGSPVTVAEGTFSLNSPTLTFTPAPGYAGNPSFTYTVSDGNGGSALGAINLTVSSALGGGSGGSSIGALDAGLSPDFQVQPEQRSESSSFGGYTTETEVTPTEFVLPAVRESLKERGAMVQRMSGATSVADVAEIRSDSLFAGLLVDPALYVLPAVEAVQLELTEAQGRAQPSSARLAPGAQIQLNDRGDRSSATPAPQFPNLAAPATDEGDAVESAGAPQPAAAKSTTGGDAAVDDAASSAAGERGAAEPAGAARPAGRMTIGDALADDARASAAAQPPRPLGTASFAAQLREESAKLRADPFAGRIR